ncbi:response regulator [Polaribacter sp. WD7]|uniref:response regulator n=1 Tax=Polaribacter sp. WD7 TaxID=2269061 RepID=UPI0015F0B7B8|nr:response regulator [Polaribacter sp. WD7]
MKTSSNNLLVIEDNLYIREKIAKEAKKIVSINDIFVTETLEQAFTHLNQNNFEIITLDLSLPDGSGLEVLRWLKKNKTEKKVFVFSTSTELKRICLRYGATAFFDKSEGFDDLIDTIKYA